MPNLIQKILLLNRLLATLASRLVSLQCLLGAQVVATVVTIVNKTVGKMPAFHVIPHIRLGHVGELEAKGARVTTSTLIFNDVFVKILWLGNLS